MSFILSSKCFELSDWSDHYMFIFCNTYPCFWVYTATCLKWEEGGLSPYHATPWSSHVTEIYWSRELRRAHVTSNARGPLQQYRTVVILHDTTKVYRYHFLPSFAICLPVSRDIWFYLFWNMKRKLSGSPGSTRG